MQIGIIEEEKKEVRYEFKTLEDLYSYADKLLTVVRVYESVKIAPKPEIEN